MRDLLKLLNAKTYEVELIEKDNFFIYVTIKIGDKVATISHTRSGNYYIVVGFCGPKMFSQEFAKKVYEDVRKDLRKERNNEK